MPLVTPPGFWFATLIAEAPDISVIMGPRSVKYRYRSGATAGGLNG